MWSPNTLLTHFALKNIPLSIKMSSASGGLCSPYLLPGLRPWTPRGLQSPRLPLLLSPKILKLYSATCSDPSYIFSLDQHPPPGSSPLSCNKYNTKLIAWIKVVHRRQKRWEVCRGSDTQLFMWGISISDGSEYKKNFRRPRLCPGMVWYSKV